MIPKEDKMKVKDLAKVASGNAVQIVKQDGRICYNFGSIKEYEVIRIETRELELFDPLSGESTRKQGLLVVVADDDEK